MTAGAADTIPSAVLAAASLPRAAALTDLVTAPAAPCLSEADREALATRLGDGLARRTTSGSGSARRGVRLDAFALRRPADLRTTDAPFRWSPHTARRALGLEAARACLHAGGPPHRQPPGPTHLPSVPARGATPADAAAAVLARHVADGRGDRRPPGSLAHWLARATPGARAAVLAEAASWATQLVTALDWHRFAQPPEVGGPDRWWEWSGPPRVALRGRADVRATTGGGPGREAGPVLLTVVGGWPSRSSRIELGLAALVDALGPASQPAPVRVVGWWPECGRVLALTPDRTTLEPVVDAVLAAAVHRLRPRVVAA